MKVGGSPKCKGIDQMPEHEEQLASQLIDEYDGEALIEATARADTFLDMGDRKNHSLWCRVRDLPPRIVPAVMLVCCHSTASADPPAALP